MKKIYLALVFLTVGLTATAQKFSIKGTVSDTLNSPMASATVMLLNPKDSSLVNFGVTSAAGAFEIKNVSKGTYQLKISFVGYSTFIRNFTTPDAGTTYDLGRLKLQPRSQDLADVVIKGERNPVTVKRDTIEFNAGSFKTKANANVEDLLKKMPGIEVESDGTINAQGEQVQQVTVDGREFFGRDPKLATRNLPADAVDKVQVFDKKSEQTQFTGIDDGQKTKTINLELKEEKRNAAFGNLMAGYGTDNRYTGKASINRFNKGSQLSFLGMGNNINEQGFSVGDAMNFSGGGQQMMGGGGGSVTVQIGGNNSTVPMNFGGRQNGIMTNYAGGLNFNQDLNNKKTQIGSNYFYSWLEQNVDKDVNRFTNLGPFSNNYTSNNKTLSNSQSHRANIKIDHKIDSANSLLLNSSLSYSDSEQNESLKSLTATLDGDTINTSNQSTYNNSIVQGLNNSLLLRHRFKKKGRTLSSNLTYNVNETEANGTLNSTNYFKENDSTGVISQISKQLSQNQTIGASLSYTEPLGNRKYLEANYNFRTNLNDVERMVSDVDINGEKTPNVFYSSDYSSNYLFNRPALNFRINRQKYNVTVGTSYQSTRLTGEGQAAGTPFEIDRTFENWLPSAHFNYDFSSVKHLRLDYETSMREPSITQLQPVVDNSNPLNVYMGNPELKPAYVQTANLHYSQFDPVSFVNFFAMGSLTYQNNAIINAQRTNEKFVRTTQPVNVDNSLNANVNLNYGFRIQKLLSRFNLGTSASINKGVNVIGRPLEGDVEYDISTTNMGGNARYNFTFKEILQLDLTANVRQTDSKSEVQGFQNQRYINSTYGAETNVTILKNWQLNADFNYYIYDSKTNDFYQTIPILNVWLSRFVLKANAGEIKVGVSNLLDKSLGVTQTANQNYIQQERLNNLGRYVMVSFTYALNKQLNPFGGGSRRPGGMRMMMRAD
jgi:hypothetical protein